jgi:tetratricopeptide (TPR) repeat protein
LYWRVHQYDNAKAAFERELAVEPDHAQALAYLGDIAMKAADLEKAESLLTKAVQLNSDIRIAYADLGSIYIDQKQYPEALAALKKALKLDPDQPDTHFRLGRLYRAMGNTAEADQEFAKVKELNKRGQQENLLEKMPGSSPPASP